MARQNGRVRGVRQAEVRMKTDGDTGSGGDKWHIAKRGTEPAQIVVADCIDNGDTNAACSERCNPRANGFLTSRDDIVGNVPDLQLRLCLEHPDQIRVVHRRERVIAHTRFAQKVVAHEQVTLEDRTPVLRKSRTRNREITPECFHERFGDRTDVSRRRGIECGAVLEVDLPGAARLQVLERAQRLSHRFRSGNGPRLERHDHCVRIEVE